MSRITKSPIMARLLIATSFMAASPKGFAQLLPEGTGAIAIGQRQYSNISTQYDANGRLRSIGSRIDMNFDSKQMASGALGTDIKRLYDEMKKFDSANTGEASLADQLSFGNLRGNIDAKINAQYIGVAYGVMKNLTVFTGVPHIRSSVTTDITMEGDNTASAVKARLGNLPFKDIQDGLDTASEINIWTIKRKISDDYGYIPADKWEYSGIGDLLLGARSSVLDWVEFGAKYNLQITGQVEFPTGHVDNPDILTDAPISKGYIAPMISAQQTASFGLAELGLDTGIGFGVPTKTVRRVPVDNESLITKDRRTEVNWIPGPETRVVASFAAGPSLFKGAYRLGMIKHLRDRYSGSLQGNYGTLEKDSEFEDTFHEVTLTVNTVDAFLSNKFSVPMLASITAHESLSGRNNFKSRYIELSIAGFFKGSTRNTVTESPSPVITPQKREVTSKQDSDSKTILDTLPGE